MNSMTKQPLWYGELRSPRGNAIVIHDQALPDASPGRIYLYNSNRQAIIEYVKDIVESNLHDLDEQALQQAKSQHSQAWTLARQEFINKQKGSIELDTQSTTSEADSEQAEAEVELSDELESFEDEWDDDSDTLNHSE
ncbi:MAG: hypothetical protein ACPGUD_03255 [Parashewanella sp.]